MSVSPEYIVKHKSNSGVGTKGFDQIEGDHPEEAKLERRLTRSDGCLTWEEVGRRDGDQVGAHAELNGNCEKVDYDESHDFLLLVFHLLLRTSVVVCYNLFDVGLVILGAP